VALYVYGVVEPKAATPSGKGIGGAKLSVSRVTTRPYW
jgi:hypothetical protein